MKILQFKSGQQTRLGICVGERVVDLAAAYEKLASNKTSAKSAILNSAYDLINAEEAGRELAREICELALAKASADYVLPLEGLKLDAPITRPEKILGVGVNYVDHVQEMGHNMPKTIVNFAMFGNALIGPSDPIIIPRNSEMIDWEAELVVVIGRKARFVDEESAMDYVLGYACGNDVCVRDHQKADPHLLRGKTQDGHAPMGPWIITADEVGDPSNLKIRLSVNGVEKQNGATASMIFNIPRIISFLSSYFTLKPGDVIFTGTPAGVGMQMSPPQWLKPGDRVDIDIEKVGRLTNLCAAE